MSAISHTLEIVLPLTRAGWKEGMWGVRLDCPNQMHLKLCINVMCIMHKCNVYIFIVIGERLIDNKTSLCIYKQQRP